MPDDPVFYVHEKADNDLEDIFDYSIEQFGFARAEQYIVDIGQAFKELAANRAGSQPQARQALRSRH